MPVLTEPEWLGRKDSPDGRWVVHECEPVRGAPATSVIGKEMHIPTGDNQYERVIRAHEMMHAKVSPGDDWDKWIARGMASKRAMVACEELRVNLLIGKAGFDPMVLSDGSETASGEKIAQHGTWADVVYATIAYSNSGGLKPFLNGVRRHKRDWGKALVAISKKAVKQMENDYRFGFLASTEAHKRTGLNPYGFSCTERLAEWVDRVASLKPEKEEEQEKEKSESRESSSGSSSTSESRQAGGSGKTETDMVNAVKKIEMNTDTTVPTWSELVMERLPMPKQTRGNIGKKRVASNVGRSPRRLHRLMTDPEKRVFDKVSRGMGGIVVIDASGSMHFSKDHIRLIVEASPGATVVAYSDMDNGAGAPNAWVLAENGKMVEELPNTGAGNGVDFPMLEWAVKRRKRSSEPIVWVTDGAVCGPTGGFHNMLAMQCINYCKKNRIAVIPNVGEALTELARMRAGNRARRKWGYYLRDAYRMSMGERLQDDEV